MNRLVLIGNGFDIAHGLKTRYENFIDWYWEQWGHRLMRSGNKLESDEFCHFILNEELGLGAWYLIRDWYYQKRSMDANEFIHKVKLDAQLCDFEYKSPFFEKINLSVETKGWVDIENIYYDFLTQDFKTRSVPNCKPQSKDLNIQMNVLRNRLVEYLKSEEGKLKNRFGEIRDKIYRPIERQEIEVGHSLGIPQDELTPKNIMLLNFNYTITPEMYLADNSTVNYIHGKLDNPQGVIFGYGDELDGSYKKLRALNDNEYLRNIKSIRYMEADNYRRMLEFIESEPFQICIMGHSCGNSDRTLLNTLFEHHNCVSVKPYYYVKETGEDNYLEMVMNINRNFTDPKLMRNRVVKKPYCEPLVNSTTEDGQLTQR